MFCSVVVLMRVVNCVCCGVCVRVIVGIRCLWYAVLVGVCVGVGVGGGIRIGVGVSIGSVRL